MKGLRLRRARATPADGDARALAAANRRIVELETQNVSLQHRLDRARCCSHAAEIADAKWSLYLARQDAYDVRQDLAAADARMHEILTKLRGLNTPDPA